MLQNRLFFALASRSGFEAAVSDAVARSSFVFCNSVTVDRIVMAASRLLRAVAACVILLSFAAGSRKSYWSGCMKAAKRWDEVWSVKSAVWSVGREECRVKCEVWSMDCEVWSVKCEVWSAQCEVWSVECEVWSVECEDCSEKCEVRSGASNVTCETRHNFRRVHARTGLAGARRMQVL